MMLQLPLKPTTRILIAFGNVVTAATIGLLLAVHYFVAYSVVFPITALVFAAAMMSLLKFDPWLIVRPYTLYHRVVRRLIMLPTRQWTLVVLFYLVLFGHRVFGGRLDLGAPGPEATMWHDKIIAGIMGGSGSSDVVVDGVGDQWLSGLLGWIRSTGNWWVIGLIPFLLLLSVVREPLGPSAVSVDTYTLY